MLAGLLETYGTGVAALIMGLGLGLAFGALAERSGFCFRSGLVGENRRQSAGIWVAALAVAVGLTQAGVAAGGTPSSCWG